MPATLVSPFTTTKYHVSRLKAPQHSRSFPAVIHPLTQKGGKTVLTPWNLTQGLIIQLMLLKQHERGKPLSGSKSIHVTRQVPEVEAEAL